jgi:hypothetical protein
MITIALRPRPMRRASATRPPPALTPMLAVIARALRVLDEPNLHSVSTRRTGLLSVPTFINYDVLDVIGAGRRVNYRRIK